MKNFYPYYLAGRPVLANEDLVVTSKFTGEIAARVALADAEAIDAAIAAATAAATPFRRWPAHRRQAVLERVVKGITDRREDLARTLAIEAGKPMRDARGEVTRAIDTFRISAEEATRIHGEYLPLDIGPRSEGVEAITKRVPVGPVALIAPFNFPLNLVAHKVGPALAAGCPFVLKPASATPISALILAEILAETDLPEGVVNVLPSSRGASDKLVEDDRLKLLSFTGSAEVGWALKARARKKKVVLELGGNAACIVDESADLEVAADRIVFGAYYQAGQSCISVQRILAHRAVYDALRERLVERIGQLKAGNPLADDTFLGPLITEADAVRVEGWIGEAVAAGAKVAVGGKRDGRTVEATLVENVPRTAKLSCQEVFGPVAILEPFATFDEALEAVNESDFGLQAGVFTRDLQHAFRAWNELEVGGVIVNDVPSFRVDSMPYGGVKDSGLGREGVRYAIEDMTELRLLVLNKVGR
ncbi:MAG: aldehyde dehydrogenase family protein [Deltaproteobacteria bacterium]|nr:aldehyde dehydrogenase family protein [Deltaproteobacteria bacterium]